MEQYEETTEGKHYVYIPKVETPRKVIKVICALLNTYNGGCIYLGIDKKQFIHGIDPRMLDMIRDSISIIEPYPNRFIHFPTGSKYVTEDGKVGVEIYVSKGTELYYISGSTPQYCVYYKNKVFTYTDKSLAKVLSDYTYSKLPFILDYEPSDYAKRIELRKIQESNGVEIHTIGELPNGPFFYKYIDLETFLISLKANTLRFNEPSKWPDKYESRFYNAEYSPIGVAPSDTPFLYACCLTYSRESEAAWKVYSYQKTGLGAHCVELRIKRTLFRERLVKKLNNYRVFLGLVNYKDSSFINTIHAPYIIKDGNTIPTEHYDEYFKYFSLYSYLNLLLLKREAFNHEKEIRFFIIPNDANNREKSHYVNDKLVSCSEPKDVEIDWLDILDAIQIDSNCSDVEREILTERINNLVDARDDLSNEAKAALKKKLEPTPFDVYGKAEKITIGETIRVKNGE